MKSINPGLLLFLLLILFSCSKKITKSENKPPAASAETVQPDSTLQKNKVNITAVKKQNKIKPEIILSEETKKIGAKWHVAVIQIKINQIQDDYIKAFKIGGGFNRKRKGEKLSCNVQYFVPDFIILNKTETGYEVGTKSAELENPAIYITVKYDDQIIFEDWILSRKADMYQSKNKNFSFRLIGVRETSTNNIQYLPNY